MPSRRALLATAGCAVGAGALPTLAGCLDLAERRTDDPATDDTESDGGTDGGTDDGADDDPATDDDPGQRLRLRLSEAAVDDVADLGADEPVGLVGPVVAEVLEVAAVLVDEEPTPVVVGGRVQTDGAHHGPRPPFEPFETVAVDDRPLAVGADRVPAHEFPHEAVPTDDVPDDAPVADLSPYPDRVAGPIVDAIAADGRVSIPGWSAAFQLLDEYAHEGGGFSRTAAYVHHDGSDYEVRRHTITPTPFPGYAFVVRVEPTDTDPEMILQPTDLDAEAHEEVETAIETGSVTDPSDPAAVLVDDFSYLLTDLGVFAVELEE